MDPLTRDLLGASPSLRRLVLALVRDEHLADDLVQEAWVAALRRRHRPPQDPGRWAFAFVRRLLRGVRRREGRRREQEALAAEPSTSRAPDELLSHQSFLQLVGKTAEALDEPYRTVIRLRYWEDLSPPQIAERLGRPHDTVKTQLRRGLEILRERLDREHDGDRKAWVAPLRISLERLASSPAPRGLPVGALLTAAAVPVVAWLCWTLLRESPREPITMANPATGARSDEAADVPPLVAGGRAASAAQAAPDPATSAPEETRLAVTVVDDLGRPAAGAEVFVVDREAGFRFRGTTDESGVLDLTVEEGEVGAAEDPTLEDRVILAATKAGHADSFDVFVRCSLGSAGSVRIELRGPELVLEGLVTDAAGRAIPGAEIQPVIEDRWQTDGDLLLKESLPWVRADSSGSFRVDGLVPGVHMLTVRATGWVPSMLTVDGRAGGVVECAVVLGEAGSVAGIVRDQQGNPVPGALLTHDVLDFDEINRWKENRADPDGYYQVDGLPPGRHMLWAQDAERSGLMSRDWVEVGAGTIEYWDPVLEPVNGIRVRVVDEQGIGLEDRRVEFLFQSGTEFWHREFETGPDGRALVFDLPPDRAIQVKVRGGPERFSRAYRAGLKPAAEEILLVVSPTEPTGSISGVLLTDQGAPPPAATAWLFSTTTSDDSSVFIDQSSGEFAIGRVPGGTYELVVLWDGHGQFSMGRVDLIDGEQVDRRLTRMPATGRAVIDWSWPVGGGGAGPRFSLITKTFAGKGSLVSDGPAPPPDHLDLLPGQYALIAEQDKLLQRSDFRVESGREVRVVSGPGLQQR